MHAYQKAEEAVKSFRYLLDILSTLRSPDGCPWDREQTPKSLRESLIEEAYETVDAIDSDDTNGVREELGDVYLLVSMLSLMNEEDGKFSVSDVLEEISAKLIRRHPHVFGDSSLASAEEVLKQWDEIKETVEGRPKKTSILDSVSRSLPPLERAYKLQKKAAKKGFDWKCEEDVWDKVEEEIAELKEARDDTVEAEMEMGDLLFSVINICRYLKIDPAIALHKANQKFVRRFKGVERRMKEAGEEMSADTLERMDMFWNEEKKSERD